MLITSSKLPVSQIKVLQMCAERLIYVDSNEAVILFEAQFDPAGGKLMTQLTGELT